ncbi:pyruvate decarboxylase 1-like, partial [Arachis duranensis]
MRQYLKYPHWYCAVALDQAVSLEAFIDPPVYCRTWFCVMFQLKDLFRSTNHPHFIGTYRGAVSTAFCAEIVESADAYLFARPIFNDYCSVGYSHLLKKDKAIIVKPERVVIGNGPAFGCVLM